MHQRGRYWLRSQPGGEKDPIEAKKKKKATFQARPYAVEGLRDKGTSKRYRDKVINRFKVLQYAHDLEEQWSLFT